MKILPPKYCLLWGIAMMVLTAVGSLIAADTLYPLPLENRPFATVVAAVDGTPLRTFADRNGIRRLPVTLDQVSPVFIEALLGYEDQWFYYHPGINPLSIARAVLQNLKAGRVISGASTLTMQVARLIDPHGRSIPGKCKQVFRALQLEWHWPKERILTYYINHAPYGGTLEGVQAAAYAYLGKSAKELSHAEAALLAVLPQAPSRLRPDRSPERAQQARDKVLERLQSLAIWPADVIRDAKQEVVFAQHHTAAMDCPILARRLYAAAAADRPESPERVLISTIDAQLQYRLDQLAHQFAFHLPPANSIAILVVDNQTLAVRAYVGSASFENAQRYGQVDMVTALRSPGSTLKPFLYGLSLDAGLIHSQSLLSDAPIVSGVYRPGNFSDGFSGPVSATTALQQSLNVPAVQLLEAYGPQQLADRLRNAGLQIRFPVGGRANLSMILGGVGTTLESLVTGYTALARGGLCGQLRYLADDPVVERYLLSPGAAWIVRDMLRHPFPGQRVLHLAQNRPSFAWKTGTSYGFRDAWALAVGNAATAGVWIGRPDGTPSPGQYGSATASPLLMQVLEVLDMTPDEAPRPSTVTEAEICWPSGWTPARNLALGLACHERRKAWILGGAVPPTLGDPLAPDGGVVRTVMVNAKTGQRVDQTCVDADARPVRVALWPKRLEPWLPDKWRRAYLVPPPDPACPHMPGLVGADIRIDSLSQDAVLTTTWVEAGLPTIVLKTIGGMGRQFWYLNGKSIAVIPSGQVAHYTIPQAERYQLAVVDEAGNADQIAFEVISRL